VQLSWPTFVLEIVNFLVLVWILKRFLYKPVLQAIAQRKASIDKTLSDAKARQADAQALEQQYKNRLGDWEQEKETLRAGVLEEINALRATRMQALEQSLAQEREKARVLDERRLNELADQAQQNSVRKGVQFTARLFERLAGPELEATLVGVILEDLSLLPDDQLEAIRTACRTTEPKIKVISAFPLPPPQRNVITKKLQEVAQNCSPIEFSENNRLLSGLRVTIGPWVLRANLEDELEFLASVLRHDS
jgi:F-type H+-transporting ATPase subunit b